MRLHCLLVVPLLMSLAAYAGSKQVSLTQLINSPEEYLGQNVSVYGYFAVGVGARVFLSENHAVAGDIASSVVVVDKSPNGEIMKCRSMPVYVYAVFKMHRQQYSLVDVSRITGINGDPCFVSVNN